MSRRALKRALKWLIRDCPVPQLGIQQVHDALRLMEVEEIAHHPDSQLTEPDAHAVHFMLHTRHPRRYMKSFAQNHLKKIQPVLCYLQHHHPQFLSWACLSRIERHMRVQRMDAQELLSWVPSGWKGEPKHHVEQLLTSIHLWLRAISRLLSK